MALDFVAGCVGGCAGILVGHPLDTVKVHLQTQDQRNPVYRGAFHCFTDLLHRESVWGLYRGMAAPLAGVAAVNAVTFGVYGLAQRWLGAGDSLSGQFLAGSLSGLAQSGICAPLEQLKTRSQLLGVGPLQCAADALRREGPRGLFRGLAATILRDTPAMGVYFATYEAMTRGSAPAPTWLVLTAGGTAGAVSWAFTYPIDVLKSRLQADGADGSPRKYSGMADCLRQSVRSDGWPCLTRGLGTVVARAFPANAACFFTVTLVLRWDQERRSRSQQLLPAQYETGFSQLRLELQELCGAWRYGYVADMFDWRHNMTRVSACGFLKLEDTPTTAVSHDERQAPKAGESRDKWSALHYEAAYRLFLHTADFTESSWLNSAEFLSPPQSGGKQQSLWKDGRGHPSDSETAEKIDAIWRCTSAVQSQDNDSSGSTQYQDDAAVSTPQQVPPSVQKYNHEADSLQIMGSPASGVVRKPDAVRHISQGGGTNQPALEAEVDLFHGYIMPVDNLWLDEDVDSDFMSIARVRQNFSAVPLNE